MFIAHPTPTLMPEIAHVAPAVATVSTVGAAGASQPAPLHQMITLENDQVAPAVATVSTGAAGGVSQPAPSVTQPGPSVPQPGPSVPQPGPSVPQPAPWVAPPAVSHPCTKKIKICLWGDSHLANNRGFPYAVFQTRFSKRGFPNVLCHELDEPNIRFHLDLTNNAVGGNKMYQKKFGAL